MLYSRRMMDTQSSTFESPTQPVTPRYASFWRRLHAYGIDSLLITILCVLLEWQFGSVALAQRAPDAAAQIQALIDAGLLPADTNAQNLHATLSEQISASLSWSNVILPLLVSAAYNILFIASGWQATPGKRLFNTYVTHANGSRLTYAQSALRHLASGASTLLAGLPYLTIFFTRERLAPHDMLCNTRVVIGRTTM